MLIFMKEKSKYSWIFLLVRSPVNHSGYPRSVFQLFGANRVEPTSCFKMAADPKYANLPGIVSQMHFVDLRSHLQIKPKGVIIAQSNSVLAGALRLACQESKQNLSIESALYPNLSRALGIWVDQAVGTKISSNCAVFKFFATNWSQFCQILDVIDLHHRTLTRLTFTKRATFQKRNSNRMIRSVGFLASVVPLWSTWSLEIAIESRCIFTLHTHTKKKTPKPGLAVAFWLREISRTASTSRGPNLENLTWEKKKKLHLTVLCVRERVPVCA